MRTTLALAGAVLILTSCSSAEQKPTYALTPQPVRPDERALHLRPGVDGDTQFTLIGLTGNMTELVGSHADVRPNGRFVRVRLEMVNRGRTTALVDTMRQTLFTSDGRTYPPDKNAMLVKRQPLSFDLGASVRIQFDLWYDVPAAAKPSGLRLFGGATLTDLRDERGTDVQLPR